MRVLIGTVSKMDDFVKITLLLEQNACEEINKYVVSCVGCTVAKCTDMICLNVSF